MNLRRALLFSFFLTLLPSSLFAQYEIGDTIRRIQIGGWFGPVTPVPGTELSQVINTNLGGGMFTRYGEGFWTAELGGAYHYYPSDGPEALHLAPVYGMGLFELPFDLPIKMNAGFGAGSVYATNEPERTENWLPLFIAGYEFYFPAGPWVNIGLRLDYLLAWEQHLSPPDNSPSNYKMLNGHFIQVGLTINVNLIRE